MARALRTVTTLPPPTSWRPVISFSSAAFFAANTATGRPTTSRSMVSRLHHAQRSAGQGQVLRRVGVVAVDLRRAKGIGRQHHIRTDLVEQAADRDGDGLAPIAPSVFAGVAWAGVGTGREAGAADVANLPATDASDVLGVAESDIHRSDNRFHALAPGRARE
jgi:hypothetical protein